MNTEAEILQNKLDLIAKTNDGDLFKSFSSDLKSRFPDGKWVTMSGSHVFINGKTVIAGLDSMNKVIDKDSGNDKKKAMSNANKARIDKALNKRVRFEDGVESYKDRIDRGAINKVERDSDGTYQAYEDNGTTTRKVGKFVHDYFKEAQPKIKAKKESEKKHKEESEAIASESMKTAESEILDEMDNIINTLVEATDETTLFRDTKVDDYYEVNSLIDELLELEPSTEFEENLDPKERLQLFKKMLPKFQKREAELHPHN